MFETADEWLRFFEHEDVYAFCAKIAENPEDIAPQLVFADWLEERYPDPEFVEAYRRHIFYRTGYVLPAPADFFQKIAHRAQFGNGRLYLLSGQGRVLSEAAQRLCATGMVGTLSANSSMFDGITNFRSLFSYLHLMGLMNSALIDNQIFASLTSFEWDNGNLDRVAVEAFATILNLRHLILKPRRVDPDSLELLLNGTRLSNLEHLEIIQHGELSTNTVALVANSSSLRNLKRLTIQALVCSNADALAIIRSPFLTQLESLNPPWQALNADLVVAIANSPILKAIKRIEDLRLRVSDREDQRLCRIILDSPYLDNQIRQLLLRRLESLR